MVFRWMASEAISWGERGANYMAAVAPGRQARGNAGKTGSKAPLMEGL